MANTARTIAIANPKPSESETIAATANPITTISDTIAGKNASHQSIELQVVRIQTLVLGQYRLAVRNGSIQTSSFNGSQT